MTELKRKSHAVYLCTYHMVFVTKYRKPVITDEIGEFMKKQAAPLCQLFQGRLISAETDGDHIHLLVELPPQVAPAEVVRVLKTQLAKKVRAVPAFDKQIKTKLYGEHLWSPSYFVATTGTTVLEKVQQYIASQRTDDHHRKYVKSGKYRKH